MSINRFEKDYVGTLVKKTFTTYYQMGDIFYIMYAAEDSVLINCLIIQDYEIIMNLF